MAKTKEDIKNTKPVEVDEEEFGNNGNGNGGISQAQLDEFNKQKSEKDIPGIKSLYRVDDQWLGEVTDLNEREIAAYAIGDMQEALADPKRTKSAFSILKERAFRYKISKAGKGRDDQVILHRLEADMKTQGLGGGANFGSP
jgi:hypothetical protein